MPIESPRAGRRNLAVRIAPSALRHVRRGHPWIFDQSIERISHDGQPGDLAVVFDDKRDFAAIGLWDPTSPIRIRVLATHQTSVGPDLWRTRISEAIERRRGLVDDDEVTGLRWLHGENDRVPGLVVDGYGSTLVVKLYTPAWLAHLGGVVDALAERLGPERVILRLARSVPATSGRADGTILLGDHADGSVAFLENGHTMTADPVDGQKTGYFLDQRANRRSFGDLAEAGDVLDVFCCHGGFSVHAAAAGARSVLSTDLSPHATESARRHLAANAVDVDHQTMTGDAFEIMEQLAGDGRRFDAIVVDPPSFASRADAVPGALRAYTRLTHLALDLLRPGATLMQASCTSRIDTEMLTQTVLGAAERAGHPVDVLDVSGHDLDHPVGFPQGSYLKAVTIRSQR